MPLIKALRVSLQASSRQPWLFEKTLSQKAPPLFPPKKRERVYCVDQAGLEHTEICLPLPLSVGIKGAHHHSLPFSHHTISEIYTDQSCYTRQIYIHSLHMTYMQIYIICDIHMYTHSLQGGINTTLILGYILIPSLQFRNADTKTIRKLLFTGTAAHALQRLSSLFQMALLVLQVISRGWLESHRVTRSHGQSAHITTTTPDQLIVFTVNSEA